MSSTPVASLPVLTLVTGVQTGATTINGTAYRIPRGASGGMFVQNVSAQSGSTPTLNQKLQFQDPVSGTWIDLKDYAQANTISFAQVAAATGTAYLSVSPSPLTTTVNKAYGAILPWYTPIRIVTTLAAVGNSYTVTVSFVPQQF